MLNSGYFGNPNDFSVSTNSLIIRPPRHHRHHRHFCRIHHHLPHYLVTRPGCVLGTLFLVLTPLIFHHWALTLPRLRLNWSVRQRRQSPITGCIAGAPATRTGTRLLTRWLRCASAVDENATININTSKDIKILRMIKNSFQPSAASSARRA